jgi:uncharacterized protein (UPF0335 family)
MNGGSNGVDGGHLKAFIDRIEKLEEEKRALADDVKDIYAEAKGTGFDPKIMRKIIALRKKREEFSSLVSEVETRRAWVEKKATRASKPKDRGGL